MPASASAAPNKRRASTSGSDLPLSGRIAHLKPESFYAAGTATLPLGTQFALFGKLGAARNHVDDLGPAKDDTRVLLGAGLTYMFTSTLSGVVEYEDFGKLVGGVPFTVKSRVFTLGLRASF
jgi:OOP family OmpA-OmpF porin